MNKLIKNIKVPTGNICILKGDYGKLEFLSIGDYGKEKNIKADFLGLNKDINGVPDGNIMSLTEKWVITISSQYGCSMNCTFCDVPKVGKGRNATVNDLTAQVLHALELHPEIKHTKRLNLHYARMGEPTFNYAVLDHAMHLKDKLNHWLGNSLIHPVVSTMMPKKYKFLEQFINHWCHIKNSIYEGEAGLQLSINSTCDKQREEMFNGNSLSLKEISIMAKNFRNPKGRKYTLNFALADNYELNANKLIDLFDPEKFIIKITPMHLTKACESNKIITSGGYNYFTPYKEVETKLKNVGFDVLVFIPSLEEDKSRITCGNVILA